MAVIVHLSPLVLGGIVFATYCIGCVHGRIMERRNRR